MTKRTWTYAAALAAALMMSAQAAPALAQRIVSKPWGEPHADSADGADEHRVLGGTSVARFHESDLSGPRLGFTWAGTDGETEKRLRDNGMGAVVSQFGWHFEHNVTPVGGGPVLVTECVPLFGGVEFGKLIPTVNLALGIRMPSGLEFGAGPSFTLVDASGKANSAIVLAVGRSLDYSGVNIPLNAAVSVNNKGARLTLLAGYAIHRAER